MKIDKILLAASLVLSIFVSLFAMPSANSACNNASLKGDYYIEVDAGLFKAASIIVTYKEKGRIIFSGTTATTGFGTFTYSGMTDLIGLNVAGSGTYIVNSLCNISILEKQVFGGSTTLTHNTTFNLFSYNTDSVTGVISNANGYTFATWANDPIYSGSGKYVAEARLYRKFQ